MFLSKTILSSLYRLGPRCPTDELIRTRVVERGGGGGERCVAMSLSNEHTQLHTDTHRQTAFGFVREVSMKPEVCLFVRCPATVPTVDENGWCLVGVVLR